MIPAFKHLQQNYMRLQIHFITYSSFIIINKMFAEIKYNLGKIMILIRKMNKRYLIIHIFGTKK